VYQKEKEKEILIVLHKKRNFSKS